MQRSSHWRVPEIRVLGKTLHAHAVVVAAGIALALAGCASAPTMQEATLRVIVFQKADNLPLLVGVDKGFFARQKLTVNVTNTPNSDELRGGLAAGRYDLAHSAVDNSVAMVELAKHDSIIVMGGSINLNEFMVRSDIDGFAGIRGKVLAVDAPNTAYALVAKKILKNKGLVENRDYTVRVVGGTMQRAEAIIKDPTLAASMINPPFVFTVRERGVKSLGRASDLVGPYQDTGAFVMRKWAESNAGVLERYLSAYVEATRYSMNPANRAEMIAFLGDRFKLPPPIAEQTYAALMSEGFGLAKDSRFNVDGFRNVLAIRADIEGMWGGAPPAPDRYLDLSYYDRALKQVK